MEHLEAHLDTAIATLKASLPAQLAAINAAYATYAPAPGIVLEVPADDAYLLGGDNIVLYPSVEVSSPDLTMTNLSLGQYGSDLSFFAAIRVLCLDPHPPTLYRRCLRYGLGVLRVMLTPGAFGAGVNVDRSRGVRGAYRFNPEVNDRDDHQGGTLLVFALEAFEVNP